MGDHTSMATTESPSTATSLRPAVQPEASGKKHLLLKWGLLILPLGYLWFRLIDNLELEWSSNPQYSYGMVVPLLVIGLLLRRWQREAGWQNGPPTTNPWPMVILAIGLAFLYLPTRLVEAATPEWRPLQWMLAFQIIGLTLYGVYLAGGKSLLRMAAFPIVFFLVAVPWPTLFEASVIQGMSRMNAAMVVGVLDVLDVPAIQHGNVIEVSTGMVGINDACSGIRSFQSSLMISLFLGEYFFFNWRRRLVLVPISFALAILLNLSRTSLLTWIAAKKGTAAIAQYHDEAGWTILFICTGLLWATAWLLNCRNIPRTEIRSAGPPLAEDAQRGELSRRRMNRFGLALIIWLAAVETGVGFWYQVRESHVKPGPNWAVSFPTNDPTYKDIPFTVADHELLRFDSGQQGEWQQPPGIHWQVFYFNWVPGRVAGYLAKRHTPDICLKIGRAHV